MAEKFTACQTCGFPKEVERTPVFLKDDIFSLIHYEENVCKECGHQSDGSTLPVIHKMRLRLHSKSKELLQENEHLTEENMYLRERIKELENQKQ